MILRASVPPREALNAAVASRFEPVAPNAERDAEEAKHAGEGRRKVVLRAPAARRAPDHTHRAPVIDSPSCMVCRGRAGERSSERRAP
jgi:hypothetical protein